MLINHGTSYKAGAATGTHPRSKLPPPVAVLQHRENIAGVMGTLPAIPRAALGRERESGSLLTKAEGLNLHLPALHSESWPRLHFFFLKLAGRAQMFNFRDKWLLVKLDLGPGCCCLPQLLPSSSCCSCPTGRQGDGTAGSARSSQPALFPVGMVCRDAGPGVLGSCSLSWLPCPSPAGSFLSCVTSPEMLFSCSAPCAALSPGCWQLSVPC